MQINIQQDKHGDTPTHQCAVGQMVKNGRSVTKTKQITVDKSLERAVNGLQTYATD